MMARKIVFGGPAAASTAWTSDAFHAVDDRVRGGGSQSYLKGESLPDGKSIGHFYGLLDTSTLGVAGFASQACSQPFDWQGYQGLTIVILTEAHSPPTDDEKTSLSCPTDFTLNLKMDVPYKRPDGRNQSTISYEYAFSSRPDAGSSANTFYSDTEEKALLSSPIPATRLRAAFSEFKPNYRGRPADDAPPLDVSQIREISIMCRSNFDRQSGKFDLKLLEIAAYGKEQRGLTPAWLEQVWRSAYGWWQYLVDAVLRRQSRGGLKL